MWRLLSCGQRCSVMRVIAAMCINFAMVDLCSDLLTRIMIACDFGGETQPPLPAPPVHMRDCNENDRCDSPDTAPNDATMSSVAAVVLAKPAYDEKFSFPGFYRVRMPRNYEKVRAHMCSVC